jgi:hypothetical protein
MVNYLYDLDKVEASHAKFRQGEVARSRAVGNPLRPAPAWPGPRPLPNDTQETPMTRTTRRQALLAAPPAATLAAAAPGRGPGLAQQAGDHRRALPARRRHRRLRAAAVRGDDARTWAGSSSSTTRAAPAARWAPALAAKAAPDGYTFFMGAVHHAIAPSMYPKLDYNIETDFVPVGLVSSVPQVIVVNPGKVQATTLPELLDFLRKNPGKLNYGSAGNGTSHHLAGELFKLQTKTFITHIPYRGAGPALQDLIAGQVDMMFDGLGSSAAHIKGGRCGHRGGQRQARAGLPRPAHRRRGRRAHYKVATWYGIWAPKGTPPRPSRDAGRDAQGLNRRRAEDHVDRPGHRDAQPVRRRLRPLRRQRGQALGRGGEGLGRETRLTPRSACGASPLGRGRRLRPGGAGSAAAA